MDRKALLCAVVLAALLGCEREAQPGARAGAPDAPAVTPGTPGDPGTATGTDIASDVEVQMIDSQGRQIGTARLSEAAQGVEIAIQVSNLPPGPKGFHIHEHGQCDPPEFQTAGAHFAPLGRQHGFENPQGPHAGDLPNLPVRQDGRADTTVVAREVTLRDMQQNSLLRDGGTSLLIHANPDDYRTDPSGESGARIACGVIRAQQLR